MCDITPTAMIRYSIPMHSFSKEFYTLPQIGRLGPYL